MKLRFDALSDSKLQRINKENIQMKKKVLLSSIVTIALCLCLIAGSTYALFTSQSQTDISVKAAKVEMTASLTDLKL